MTQPAGLNSGPLEVVVNVPANDVERAPLPGSSVRVGHFRVELAPFDQGVHGVRLDT